MRQCTRHSGYHFIVGLVLVGGCMTAGLNAVMPSSQRQSVEILRETAAEALTAAAPAPSVQAEIKPAASVATPPPAIFTIDNADAARSESFASIPSPTRPTELPVTQQEIAAANTPADEQSPNLEKDVLLKDVTGTLPVEHSDDRDETRQDLSYLAYYAYSEVAPETKPAEIVLGALKTIPPGTPIDEIKRVSRLLGLNFIFMKTVAKIESGFDPKQRTGSYIGLFQISRREFAKYGVGDILNPRDNAVAAALKIMAEAALFEMFTHRVPTLNDLYLVHQQGVDGAAEHVSHPRRLAWRSMCATDEGKEKGARWCKQAIWANTLPALKRAWRNVDNVSSGAFVAMWQERVSHFYVRYSPASAN